MWECYGVGDLDLTRVTDTCILTQRGMGARSCEEAVLDLVGSIGEF
jgi:hypothetical protein